MQEFEIITTRSGARCLRSRIAGETCHPGLGPVLEAELLHVRQQRLAERAGEAGGEFVVWDVGLGAAANALAALAELRTAAVPVKLHSFDSSATPLEFALQHLDAFDYLAPHAAVCGELLAAGIAAHGAGEWRFHLGDFRETMRAAPPPHAILYDIYSPKAVPALWTLEHFTALRRCLVPERPCLLTTFSRSSAVRLILHEAGWLVGRGLPLGEKEETTCAANTPELLADLLDEAWFARARFNLAARQLPSAR